MKAIRAISASSSLFVASLVAHILAGASSISIQSAGAIMLMIATITWFLSRKSGDPVRVAFAILIAQNFGHFILGGQASSDSQMLASHLIAGFLSYQLIRYFDKSLPSIGEFFQVTLPPVFDNPSYSFVAPDAHPNYSYRALSSIFHSLVPSLRAPPSH